MVKVESERRERERPLLRASGQTATLLEPSVGQARGGQVVTGSRLTDGRKVTMKRLFDICVSGCVLLVLAPLLLPVMALLRLTGEGEVFYLQQRMGYGGKLIWVTKLATMLKNSPSLGTGHITVKDDPRVLPLGKFLRKSKLNEMPQFWDVFVGKLSLVGWRPLMPTGFANYPAEVQQKIVQVKPGLTGIGSLVFRDEEAVLTAAQGDGRDLTEVYRDDIMPYKGALECWYVDHASFVTDVKILIATALAVLVPGWRGFWKWFPDLPNPQSPLLKAVLKVGVVGDS